MITHCFSRQFGFLRSLTHNVINPSFYAFALNLILYKHVEVAIKLLHQKSRNKDLKYAW